MDGPGGLARRIRGARTTLAMNNANNGRGIKKKKNTDRLSVFIDKWLWN